MKKYLFGLTICLLLTACSEKDIEKYHGGDFLQFRTMNSSGGEIDSKQTVSFNYEPSTVTGADVNFNMVLIGNLSDDGRPFRLGQVMVEGADNAVEGVHYVPFDSDELSEVYVLEGGISRMQVPVKILRPDDNKTYTLRVEIVDNAYFKAGSPARRWCEVTFASSLTRPAAWDDTVTNTYFGKYSRTKHQWMIDVTGQKWDEAYTKTVRNNQNLLVSWRSFLTEELVKENERRLAAGKELFKDEDGELIVIPS